MPAILDIATAVPDYPVSRDELVKFYADSLRSVGPEPHLRKLNILSGKTKIVNRFSCIPDFNKPEKVLFTNGNYLPGVERRTEIYKEKLLPLAINAVDKLIVKAGVQSAQITHLITVSCTGLFAPGFEFLISEHYGLQKCDRIALNFLGCYAAFKALKQANYIAESNPEACILIVCAELCSLHFTPSETDEDMVANLLFSDGAAACFVCGDANKLTEDKMVLKLDSIGSACIPDSLGLMTWNISSTSFRMFLHKNLVTAIKENIYSIVSHFLGTHNGRPAYWAVHPGGIRIVEAVKESLKLKEHEVEDSLFVLEHFGNMSSPTILFILERLFNKLGAEPFQQSSSIFGCAFGPGISVEMISLSTARN